MIFLAIDEMMNDECGMMKIAAAKDSWLLPSSSFIIHHSSLSQSRDEREAEEACLERAHALAAKVDE
jgi:hypothetical protein